MIGIIDQIRRIDPKCLGDTVQPPDRDGARPGLQPSDSLRSRWRNAGLGDLIKSHSARAANFANSSDHRPIPVRLLTNVVFGLSYKFSCVAREKRLGFIRRIDGKAVGWTSAIAC